MRWVLVLVAWLAFARIARGAEPVLFILDVSGSMSEKPRALDPSDLRFPSISLGPPTRFRLALEELEQHLSAATRQGASTGLVAFGHRSGECDDVQVAVPLGPGGIGAIRSFVGGLSPRGMTPLSAAIAAAEQHLKSQGLTGARVVLLTDGWESCFGDPFAAAGSLQKVGRLDVVGIGLGVAEANHMGSLASAGGGQLSLIGSGGLVGPRTTISVPTRAPAPRAPTWGVGDVGGYETPARAPAAAPPEAGSAPEKGVEDRPIVAPESVPRLVNFTKAKPPAAQAPAPNPPEAPRPAPSREPELSPLPLL